MSDTELPRTPADITPSWLSRVLREAGALPSALPSAIPSAIRKSVVTDVVAETIAFGEGFASTLARLELTYDRPIDRGPGSLIAKFPSQHAPTRSLLGRLGAYENEVRFYQDVAPKLDLRSPRPYFAGWDSEAQQSLLLLEDLSHPRAQDQLAGCSLRDAELAVVELARFHSTFWESPRLAELDWVPAWDSGAEFFQKTYPLFWSQLRQRTPGELADALPNALREVGEAIGSHIVAIKRRLAQSPTTLVHGDFRLDNLFFDESNSDTRIVVVDWQAVRVGRGAYDLAYFLATSLAPEMRRDRRDPLVSLYHDTLLASGVTRYTVQDCQEDYGYSLLDLVSFVTLIGSTLDFDNQRGAQIAGAIIGRLSDALTEVDTERLLADLA